MLVPMSFVVREVVGPCWEAPWQRVENLGGYEVGIYIYLLGVVLAVHILKIRSRVRSRT